mgnify:CR=1 FL=1
MTTWLNNIPKWMKKKEKIDHELFINDKAIDTKDLESDFQSDKNFQTEEIIKYEKILL